ncbi:MAG: S46 family peptidase, partial [Bacteroidota bacterium]|nr:S46 family peptidase [Bacteroidota bacterium]
MIKKMLIGLFTVFYIGANAGEGMWIPLFLGELNEAEMKSMGMRISAEDIYSINNACLKDAIVIFGGGCTGDVVSDQGLLLTNHHCGYGAIQRHSSLEHDYLTNGFWAMDKSEELPNPGLSVTFLISMEDVTEEMLYNIGSNISEKVRDSIIKINAEAIKTEAVDSTSHYKALIVPFYHGNQYFLFITEVFQDVRLVGAPPSNIGKFGGDTDNWMWPRHTGDFSVFRIYADSNNKPAKYSKNNVPYKPKMHMPISLKGMNEGDFTFVFGYPGSTQQYIPSYAVELLVQERNPIRISLREKRLNVMNKYINDDDLVRIQYASKSAGIANGWKKWIGESRGIARLDAIAKKQEMEKAFQEWADADPDRKKKYGDLLKAFSETYAQIGPLVMSYTYLVEAGMGIELVRYAFSFNKMMNACREKPDKEKVDEMLEQYKKSALRQFKNYYMPIDKEIFVILLEAYF